MQSIDPNNIFNVSPSNFNSLAINIFRYQAKTNAVYAKYLQYLGVAYEGIDTIDDIPFLPISFFKTHTVQVGAKSPEIIFSSSGTSGSETSKHNVLSLKLYEESFLRGFNLFYGQPSNYCIISLLPAYLERKGSSLVYMANRLITDSNHPKSGFFLNNIDELIDTIENLEAINQPTILIGVTFALLDLANRLTLNSKHKVRFNNTTVIETGGMKGRGKELVRNELHSILNNAFGTNAIHSEYGMTELLSQAYSKGDGIFHCPPWMKVLTRDPYDPFHFLPAKKTGALNVIDLANLYSCSFIQTDDLGIQNSDGSFEVLGRMDGSQIRGCNLLVI
jgi:phenylacetate-coenzyme A ligase PaaK-like adenylate-forming protein